MATAPKIYDADAIQALEDLKQYLENNTEPSESLLPVPADAPPQKTETFIANGTIEAYLQERTQNYARLRRILRAVFELSSNTSALPVPPRDLAERCCRVFCILIRIDKAQYIGSFLTARELWDDRLPFPPPRQPISFPEDRKDARFYEKFVSEQYRFCAETIIDHSNRKIDDNLILPIVRRTQLGKGGHSRVHKVDIPPTHDELENLSTSSPHVYAIKTFRTTKQSEDNYRKELEAFRHVTDAGSRQTRGLIHFYGGFEHRGTFNLVLEYAEGRTLEDFFSRNVRPKTEDILHLWSSFFEVIRGLFTIHEKHFGRTSTVADGVADLLVQGWHQDLTPSNILLVANPPSAPFRFTFKIADLGLCHFKTIMSKASEAVDWDAFGTRTYGAPECYRRTAFAEYRRNLVSPKVDIWSLGCIICEIAIWLVKDLTGLKAFRAARKSAIDPLVTGGFRIGDCFHDGQQLLDVVDQDIESLRRRIWQRDYTTARVLELLPDMLRGDPKLRPTAEQVEHRVDQIVKDADRLSAQDLPSTPPESPPSQSPNRHFGAMVHTPARSRDPTLWTPETPVRGDSRSGQSPTQAFTHLTNTLVAIQGGGGPSAPPLGEAPNEVGLEMLNISSSQSSGRIAQRSQAEPRRSMQQSRPVKHHLSRAKVREWFNKRQHRGLGGSVPVLEHHEFLKQQLDGRDHVLMIDDAETMQAHWRDATDLAIHLAYITKRADPDGLELYFLRDGKPHKCRHSSTVGEKMRNHLTSGYTSLDGIFDSDLRKFARSITAKRQGHRPHSWRKNNQRPRSIYVLTDGKLELGENNQGHSAIQVLARSLAEADMSRAQCGIQFIRFGTDRRCRERLESLDQLADNGQAVLDLVDTEPADGNVVKMLIGAIRPLFDHQNE